jgi:hypothetical protein
MSSRQFGLCSHFLASLLVRSFIGAVASMLTRRSQNAVIRLYDGAGNVIETQFQKCGQLFIGAHNEAVSVAMRINNPDCPSFKIQLRPSPSSNLLYGDCQR